MTKDRMFHVLVVGGAALVGTAAMSVTTAACGGDIGSSGTAQDAASEEFPSELGAPAPDGAFDATAEADAFPREGPAMLDASLDARDAALEADAFPREGPAMLDATFDATPADASAEADAWPQEGPPPLPDAGGG